MNIPVRGILDSGVSGTIIDVECHLSNGLPIIVIVGLGSKAIDEAKERVRSSFSSCKLNLPRRRITINLAPADLPKETTSLDLAIAATILASSGQLKRSFAANEAIIGELSLDGTIRPVRGIIGKLTSGRARGITTFFVPVENADQAQMVPGIRVIALKSLRDLYLHLNGIVIAHTTETKDGIYNMPPRVRRHNHLALSDIVGQAQAKRALEIAAAGAHNILLNGPPGTGKSMLAKALPSILPTLNSEEMLEVTHLHSLTNNNYEEIVTERPLRSPHPEPRK